MNHEQSNHEVSLSPAPEAKTDDIQRAEDAERARSVIESIIQAEPPEDSTVVWQYAVIKAAQAVDRQEYHEAERLYHEAWRSLPKKDRDVPRMRRILGPLALLYQEQRRFTESWYVEEYIWQAYRQQSQEWKANHPPGPRMLEKYFTADWPPRVDVSLDNFHCCLKDNAILGGPYELYEWLPQLTDLCNAIKEYACITRRYCHQIQARVHLLKAFLADTEGVKAEQDEEATAIVRAREEAHAELEEYEDGFKWVIIVLRLMSHLPDILKQDLPGLSPTDRAKLEQYEELYRCLALRPEEEWERFPIMEILDLAAAYLPGIWR